MNNSHFRDNPATGLRWILNSLLNKIADLENANFWDITVSFRDLNGNQVGELKTFSEEKE
jgi:hypothetical protein